MHLDFRTEPGRLIEIKAIRKHLGTVHVLTEQYQPSKSQRSDIPVFYVNRISYQSDLPLLFIVRKIILKRKCPKKVLPMRGKVEIILEQR